MHYVDPTYERHCAWMERALALADEAGQAGEVPVAAIVVDDENTLVAEAANYRQRGHDPTAHAEVLALRQAGQIRGNWNLTGCTLYVTLEPCPMCAGAIALSRVSLLVYGADDLKTGAIRSVLNIPDSPASNHRLAVLSGVLESRCREQLQQWFTQRRRNTNGERL
ncbi:tRNA adenosine(34) deaminase TadA [Oscillatoria sp. CS-180]|uniref:tRNA adenosine(34) deaminase TadA n=1 Tax=Oscillatoria sp. CS-180 TaxID=3021720 RepID=UPI00232B8A58|nr:tRNA adenosine(34) deaminase TadA [Oscillatoria sp. CS-180]MDB9526758.1 tRNA adenosine(34) deaminase TadA [Oscillatoria sp. CS-180]